MRNRTTSPRSISSAWGASPLRRHSLIALAVAAALSSGLPTAAQAQAADAASVIYELPAQPLDTALSQLARRAGLQLLANNELVKGRQAPALPPTRGLQAALDALLRGSGLRGRVEGRTLLVEAAPAASAASETVLPAVRVRAAADREAATGPVAGYVAKRSATATKTDTPIFETPQSISVVTRDQMRDQGTSSVDEAMRYTVGVRTSAQGYSSLWDTFAVRGFQQSNASIFRDGMRSTLWNGDGRVESYGLERVEVLRGPASILYGGATPGGVVNLVTKRPPLEDLRELELQYGSFNRKQAAIDLGGPVGKGGDLQYRFTGLVRDSDTQVDHVPDDRQFIAPALTWRPSARTSLTLLSEFQRIRSIYTRDLPAQGTVLPNPNGKVPTGRFLNEPDDFYDNTSKSIGYILDHRLDDHWSVRQNVRYGVFDVDQRSVQGLGLQADLRTIDPFAYATTSGTRTLAADTAVQAKWMASGVEHVTLAGLDFRRFRYNETGRVGTTTAIDLFDPVYGRTVTFGAAPTWNVRQAQTQTGLYLQNQASIGSWRVLLGARRDRARDTSDDVLAGTSTTDKESATTWRVGVVYLTPSGLAPYFSYAQSFEPQGGLSFAQTPFSPTTGAQYETGVKYQTPDKQATLTLSAFHLKRQDVLTPDSLHAGWSVQTGEITSRGVEIEAAATIGRRTDLIGALTWNDVEVTKSNDLDLGKRPTQVPEHMASLWLMHRLAVGSAGWRFGGGVRYVGPTAGDFTNTFDVPGFTVADALISYDGADWAATLNVANLFDRQYVAGCWGMNGCSYGGRRTINATFKLSF